MGLNVHGDVWCMAFNPFLYQLMNGVQKSILRNRIEQKHHAVKGTHVKENSPEFCSKWWWGAIHCSCDCFQQFWRNALVIWNQSASFLRPFSIWETQTRMWCWKRCENPNGCVCGSLPGTLIEWLVCPSCVKYPAKKTVLDLTIWSELLSNRVEEKRRNTILMIVAMMDDAVVR